MRKTWLLAVLMLLVGGGAGLGAPKAGGPVTVQVLSAKVMKDPRFIGATVAKVARGDQLTFQSSDKDWYQVKTGAGEVGWIHSSAVKEGALTLNAKPGGGSGGATPDEIALAGRGFSPEVEGEYKSRHPEMDFKHVDGIEKTEVESEELAKFVEEGKLGGGGK